MRFAFILCLTFCWQICLAQKGPRPFEVVNTISFYQQGDSLNKGDYQRCDSLEMCEIKEVPEEFEKEFPYYAALGSRDGKFIHYEFFRIDTASYHVREYFKGSSSSDNRVMSYGEEKVVKNAFDTLIVDIFHVNDDHISYFLLAEHRLIKDGKWTEFEEDASNSFFWKGAYQDNKRTGIWSRLLYLFNSETESYYTIELGKVDYQKNSARNIYGDNGIREKPLSDLKQLLPGKWVDRSSLEDGITRYFKDSIAENIIDRYRTYMTGSEAYYQFDKSGKVVALIKEECCDTLLLVHNGIWQLHRNNDHTFIDMEFQDGVTQELELLYYSEKDGLVINWNEHPQLTK